MERQPDMERAGRLMHGPEYHAAKPEIMPRLTSFSGKSMRGRETKSSSSGVVVSA